MHSVIAAKRNGKAVFCVVFHGDSFGRITANDPAVIEGDVLLGLNINGKRQTKDLPLGLVDLLICYERDAKAFVEKCRELEGDGEKIIQWLGRGWKNTPEDAEHLVAFSFRKDE